jgi:hypothetical protein
MPATFDFDPPSAAPATLPGAVFVFGKIRPEDPWTYLPHVRLLADSRSMGASPGTASFGYAFDDVATQLYGLPNRTEHVWGGNATHPWRLEDGDRLMAVYQEYPQGPLFLLFDGYAHSTTGSLSGDADQVTISAIGAPVREWDNVVGGAWVQNMDRPDYNQDPDDIDNLRVTDFPCRFNPEGKPNRNVILYNPPDGMGNYYQHFVFGDALCDDRNPPAVKYWTLADAVRYLLITTCKRDVVKFDADYEWLGKVLSSWEPKADVPFDPTEPNSFDLVEIRCPDYDATGKPWPVAVQELVEPFGFTMSFRSRPVVSYGPGGAMSIEPEWQMFVHRKFLETEPKTLRAQRPGESFDAARWNVGAASLTWDSGAVTDHWTVDTAPPRYEVSVILYPAFAVAQADADTPSDWQVGGPAADGWTYRVWHASEAGDGFSQRDGDWISEGRDSLFDMSELLETENRAIYDAGDWDYLLPGVQVRHAIRRRPAIDADVFSREGADIEDKTQPVRKASLHVMTIDPAPTGLLEGPRFWWIRPEDEPAGIKIQEVTEGGWELMPDRLGIKINITDPNDWNIGKPPKETTGVPFPSGKVPLVECVAKPDATKAKPYVYLVLTCVIEGDRRMPASASPWNSQARYTVRRRDDARETFWTEVITPWSINLRAKGAAERQSILGRDDLDKARALAVSRRTDHETPAVSGSVSIGRLEFGYILGDRIRGIEGRWIDFAAGSQSPQFPTVTTIDRSYKGGFTTTLTLQAVIGNGQTSGQVFGGITDARAKVARKAAADEAYRQAVVDWAKGKVAKVMGAITG